MASNRQVVGQITGQITGKVASHMFGALAAAALLCTPLAVVHAQDNPVLARVNGVDIHEGDLAFAEEEIGSNMPQMPPEQKRDYLITYLTDVVIVSQAAAQQGLANRDDVKRRLAFDHNRVLMEAMLTDTAKAALTDDAMHKVYEEATKQ